MMKACQRQVNIACAPASDAFGIHPFGVRYSSGGAEIAPYGAIMKAVFKHMG